MTQSVTPSIARWYVLNVRCANDEVEIEATKKTSRIQVFKEITSRGYWVDVNKPLQQYPLPIRSDTAAVVVVTEVGVLVTPKQNLEWQINDYLALLIRVNDRIADGWDEDIAQCGYASEAEWLGEVADLSQYLETQLTALRIKRGWIAKRIPY